MENSFKNAKNLAHDLIDIADLDLTARPYNRFDIDNTTWWLITSSEWPAFKYGKIFMVSKTERIPNNKEGIYFGFNIEKGFSEIAKEFYNYSLIIDSEWLWPEFIGNFLDSNPVFLPNKIITIVVSYIPTSKTDSFDSAEAFAAQKENFEGSRISFEIKEDLSIEEISKKLNQNNIDISTYFRDSLAMSKDLRELFLKIKSIPQSDWVWVDLYIGSIVSKGTPNSSLRDIWINQLVLWKPWLRKGK